MAKKRQAAKSTSKARAPLKRPGAGRPRAHRSCLLGETIDKLARARGLSWPMVAKRAKITLVGLHAIRRGRIRPRLDTLERIADVLEVGPGRLLPR